MNKQSPRHLSRSLAVQVLYHYKLNQASIAEIETYLKEINEALYAKANSELLQFLIETSIAQFDTMLSQYNQYSERNMADIDLTEQIILVIAAVELNHNLSVPAPVVINEAVELAKRYGANDSYKFINGLVDKLASSIRST